MKIVICIPTYNEKDNIGQTIDQLELQFKNIIGHQLSILIIDDNSPDGTASVVKQKQRQYSNLVLLSSSKKVGLGAAYIKAFNYAIDKMSADLVFEFDADGSHKPEYIPLMIKEIEKGADVVVGSRYIKGGQMPLDWGLHRKFLSYFGNFIARFVLFTPQYKDMTSGYRVTKVSFLKKIKLNQLFSKQFAYKIQLYYELHRLGAKIVEYPIVFIDRNQGKSKFPRNNIVESLLVVFRLRLRDSQKLIKMSVVGGFGAVVQMFLYNLFRRWFGLTLAQNLAIEGAVISNFTLNNIWTFKESKFDFNNLTRLVIGFIKFNLSSLGSILIQNFVLVAGIWLLGKSFLIENLLVSIGILLGMIVNYLMYTRVVWKK